VNFILNNKLYNIFILGLLVLLGCNNISKKKESENIFKPQIDNTQFKKLLTFQDISFEIISIKDAGKTSITIKPSGLTIINRTETILIDGQIYRAEVEDLNNDGSPEVLIFTQSDGSGSYGNVIGYSVNNNKSMSQFYFPPIMENDKINKGYMGHDKFTISNNCLVQQFPIYNEGDSNVSPTGGMRQIEYELVNGEAGRIFEIKNITDSETHTNNN